MALRNKIALDTNMLLAITRLKIDVFGQIKNIFGGTAGFVVPEQVLQELENLARKNSRTARDVSLLKEIIKKNKVKKIKVSAENTDACLEKLASQGVMIATNDKALRKKIKVFGSHIFLKKGSLIAVD